MAQLFVLSNHCTSQIHCRVCRSKESGRWLRADMGKQYELPDNNVDFKCPYGKDWIDESTLNMASVASLPSNPVKKKTATITTTVSTNKRTAKTTPCGSCSRK